MDSNHDKFLQRELCYRYTIGQIASKDTDSGLSRKEFAVSGALTAHGGIFADAAAPDPSAKQAKEDRPGKLDGQTGPKLWSRDTSKVHAYGKEKLVRERRELKHG